MVRELTISELDVAAQFGAPFITESGVHSGFVPSVFVAKWGSLISAGIGFILGLFREEKLVGVFGAIVAENLNDASVEANECFWFVAPEHRGRGLELLNAYEAAAQARGAKRCSMIHLLSLQPERLRDLYIRRGYAPVETSYFKELT